MKVLRPVALTLGAIFVFASLPKATGRPLDTSVPTFAELVADARWVVRVRVSEVKCQDIKLLDEHHIKTVVTFTVLKTLKGEPAQTLTLEFPGGSVGTISAAVAGALEFKQQAEEYLFIDPNARTGPIVGKIYGRIRVLLTDRGEAYVARDDGAPFANASDLSVSMQGGWKPREGEATLSPEAFEAAIRGELAHPTPRSPHVESDLFHLPGRRR